MHLANMSKEQINKTFGEEAYSKALITLKKFPKRSPVQLIKLSDGNYEQSIYILSDPGKAALKKAKRATTLDSPAVVKVQSKSLGDLNPSEIVEFSGDIAVFEPVPAKK